MSEYKGKVILGSLLSFVVAVGIGAGILYLSPTNVTTTSQTGLTHSFTATVSQASTSQVGWTSTFPSGLNPPMNETFRIATNGTLFVDVRYYYYNSTAPSSFNFTGGQQLQISGNSLKLHGTFNAASNFTVLSNTSSVAIGGSDNQNEGVQVQYSIIPRYDNNGTYGFNFGWLYPSMVACAPDFALVIGNGPPDYGYAGPCTSSLADHYPLNSDGYVDGFLLAEILEVSNTPPTTCIVAVPPPQGVYIRVVNDSGSPISRLAITIQSTPAAPCNGMPIDFTNSIIQTNSSGWILFQGSFFYHFGLNYSGSTFNFTVPSDPMAWTIATVSVPSGSLTSQICGLGGAPDTMYCQASETAVVN